MIGIKTQTSKIENSRIPPGIFTIYEIEKLVLNKFIRPDIKEEFLYVIKAAKTCITSGITYEKYCKQFPRKE